MSIDTFPPSGSVKLDVERTTGLQQYAAVTDSEITQLMTEVLKELKIMNIHNSIMTDTQIQRTDVEN